MESQICLLYKVFGLEERDPLRKQKKTISGVSTRTKIPKPDTNFHGNEFLKGSAEKEYIQHSMQNPSTE
jgi:hypothetical protein